MILMTFIHIIVVFCSNSRCPVGDRCTNRRFEKRENGALKVFYADKKGCGVEAADDIVSYVIFNII